MMQNTAQVDETRSVQLQFLNGSASGRRQTEQEGKVFVPDEVIAPTILAWMEKTNPLTAERITRGDGSELAIVAFLAGESQIIHGIIASIGTWDNVFDGKRGRRERLLAMAVFTAVPGRLSDLPFHSGRKAHARLSGA